MCFNASISRLLCSPPPPPPPPHVCLLCWFFFMCVCVCVFMFTPALLLNNPAYHVVLSDDRKGSRPLVAPGNNQAQEKSLNVPQGKRPENGAPPPNTQSGRAHTAAFHGRGTGVDVFVSACILPPSLTVNHSHLPCCSLPRFGGMV